MENNLLEKIITISILGFWFLFPLVLFLSIIQSDQVKVDHPFHFISKKFKFSLKEWVEDHHGKAEGNSKLGKTG